MSLLENTIYKDAPMVRFVLPTVEPLAGKNTEAFRPVRHADMSLFLSLLHRAAQKDRFAFSFPEWSRKEWERFDDEGKKNGSSGLPGGVVDVFFLDGEESMRRILKESRFNRFIRGLGTPPSIFLHGTYDHAVNGAARFVRIKKDKGIRWDPARVRRAVRRIGEHGLSAESGEVLAKIAALSKEGKTPEEIAEAIATVGGGVAPNRYATYTYYSNRSGGGKDASIQIDKRDWKTGDEVREALSLSSREAFSSFGLSSESKADGFVPVLKARI